MKVFTSFLVLLLTPWWWIIIQRSFISGLVVFALSILLFLYWKNASKILLTLLLVLTGVLSILTIKQGFDEQIFRQSALDIQQYTRRHQFLAKELNKIYTNRFSLTYFKDYQLPLVKLEKNFFSNLDPNLYFFKSHPRERVGVEEFEKYLPLFLPLFLLGFFYLLIKPQLKILIYLILVLTISCFINPKYNLGPILLLPVTNLLITIGIIFLIKVNFKYLKKKK